MNNLYKNPIKQSIIFVDCFNTVVLRSINKNSVFKNWAKELEKNFNINWKKIYRTYKRTNFWLCFKKIFTKFILQEKFDVVLNKMFKVLKKYNNNLEINNFVKLAKQKYIEKEKYGL